MKNHFSNKGVALLTLVIIIVILVIFIGVAVRLFTKKQVPSVEMKETYETETIKKTANDGEWWIPKGFRETLDSSPTIQGGKVIEDEMGNQWVWIPCYIEDAESKNGQEMYSKATKYERTIFTENSGEEYSEILDSNDLDSIKIYGGFYIGRYEVGTDKDASKENNSRKAYIQSNKVPYRYISNSNCVAISNNFANDNNYDANKVYTKLVSSYAWDTALSFINETVKNYAINSPQGNYSESLETKNTGKTTAVCNIYDMGGNLWECTTETNNKGIFKYVLRGGNCSHTADSVPAGYRYAYDGEADILDGFRITLYIK